MIIHLLWALHFMKVYPKQDAGSAAAGGSSRAIDVKTWKKYLWPFINALAELKDIVVSQVANLGYADLTSLLSCFTSNSTD